MSVQGVLPVQAVGGVLQVTSVLASAGVSFVRVRKFMKSTNAEIFTPRGLVRPSLITIGTCLTLCYLRCVGS